MISDLPEAPSTNDPSTFATKADALIAALPTFRTEANALAASMEAIAAGTALSIPMIFDVATADADPGNGKLRLGSATQKDALVIRTDLVGADGSTWTSVLDTFDDSTSTIKGYARLVKVEDASKFLIFAVTALASPSGYKNITVINVAYSEAIPFADGDAILLEFTRTGDKGDTGAAGDTPLTYTARSSNTMLTAANFADATRISLHWTGSSAITQTIDAAATIGADNWLPFSNDSTAIVTFDPNGAEQINGASTLKVYPGESGWLLCNGTSFRTLGLTQKGGLVQLATLSPAAVAAASFASVFSSEFEVYKAVVAKLKPATDNVSLHLRTSTDGGTNYDAAASDYAYSYMNSSATPGGAESSAAAQIVMTPGVGSDTGEWVSLEITFYKPSAAEYFDVHWTGVYKTQTGTARAITGMGSRLAAADVDSFRLLFSSGNIASGDITVYGQRK